MSKFSIFITTFFLFWILFLPTYEFIPDYTINGWVKNSMVLFMVLYFRNDIVPSFKGEYKGLFWALAGYGLISVLSVFINADTISQYPAYIWSDGKQIEMESNATVKNAFYNFIYLLTFALFMRKLSMEHKIVQFIKILFYLMLGLTIWVDIDAFSRAVIDDEDIFGYVVENKFIVCYTNLFLCVLFHLQHPSLSRIIEKIIFIGILVVMITVSIHVHCTTMVVGSLIYGYFAFTFSNRPIKLFATPKFFIWTIVIADLFFLFFTTFLLQFPVVADFVVDVLHEDSTLTGRVLIFENIIEAFEDHLPFGYGFGNSQLICRFFGGATNPQNGLMEIFINVGILGCIAYLTCLYHCLKSVGFDVNKYPLVIFILTMIIISTIEVPFNQSFLFFSFILLAYPQSEDKTISKYEE